MHVFSFLDIINNPTDAVFHFFYRPFLNANSLTAPRFSASDLLENVLHSLNIVLERKVSNLFNKKLYSVNNSRDIFNPLFARFKHVRIPTCFPEFLLEDICFVFDGFSLINERFGNACSALDTFLYLKVLPCFRNHTIKNLYLFFEVIVLIDNVPANKQCFPDAGLCTFKEYFLDLLAIRQLSCSLQNR